MEGSKLGKYEVRAIIGRGAVGVVYEAWDPVLDRKVAIKTLPLSDKYPDEVEKHARFQREAQAAGRLHHPNIVAMFDYGETPECAYLVMECLPGPSLKRFLESEPRPSQEAMWHVMNGLLTGLQQSHRRGVMHRDIKPANLVFGEDGSMKITDFGVAHLENSEMTQVGSVLGTPGYMSPEQVLGRPVDARSDVYSAGVVLYEMLTGRRPFQGNAASIMHRIVHDPPLAPSELATGLAPEFDAILAKVLAKSPADRYQSAAEFAAALRPVLRPASVDVADTEDRTIIARAASPPPAPKAAAAAPPARPRFAKALVLAGGVAVLVLGGVVWRFAQPGTETEKAAPATKVASAPPPAATSNAPSAAATPPAAEAPTQPPPPPAAPGPEATAAPPAPTAPTPGSIPPATAAPPPAPTPAPSTKPPAPAPATTAEAPPASAPAEDPVAAARPAVKDLMAGVPCSVFTAEAAPERIRLLGLTGLGDASALSVRGYLQRSVADLLPSPPVEVSMHRVDGPFCALFDTLKRAAVRFGPNDTRLNMALGEARPRYVLGTTIKAKISLPDFPARLTVDYFTADGMVQHWLATGRDQPARSELSVDTWKADKPTGTNIIAAIASSSVLFSAARPDREAAADYLKDLKTALGADNAGQVKAQLRTIEIVAP